MFYINCATTETFFFSILFSNFHFEDPPEKVYGMSEAFRTPSILLLISLVLLLLLLLLLLRFLIEGISVNFFKLQTLGNISHDSYICRATKHHNLSHRQKKSNNWEAICEIRSVYRTGCERINWWSLKTLGDEFGRFQFIKARKEKRQLPKYSFCCIQ